MGGLFPLHPCIGGSRKHAVFGRNPAGAGVSQKGRDTFLDRGRANDPRVAEADQARAFSVLDVIIDDLNFA
jgi:hypothetical protein